MILRGAFFFCLLLSVGSELCAQNSDADSYYTPIPNPPSLSKRSKIGTKPYRKDTIFLNRERKHYYFISLQTASLVGCNSCGKAKDVTTSISLLNGVTLGKKIRTGIGIGFDSYVGWQTLPAVASISWDVLGNKNRNALFIQLNYGFSKAWRQKSDQDYAYKRAEGGRMFSPVMGYRVKYHDLNLALAVGVRKQRVFSFYEYPTWNWVNGEYQPATTKSTIKQDMSRLMISLAVGWR